MEGFEKLLDEYKNMYLQFLVTGSDDYKKAYKNAQTGIEKAISDKETELEHHKKAVEHFAKSYKKDNDDIQTLNEVSSELIQNADTIHDNYETSKRRFNSENNVTVQTKIDLSTAYAILFRIGIIIILTVILLYISGAPLVLTKVYFQKVAEVMPGYAT